MWMFSVKLAYALPPGPITRHKITVSSFVVLEIAVGDVIDAISQIRVCENIVDDLPRVMIPELIFGVHPLRCGCVFRAEAIVSSSVQLPGHLSELNCINC